jgi:hypothetical protein
VSRINEHEVFPDEAAIAYLQARHLPWRQDKQHFGFSVVDRGQTIGYCLDGTWVAKIRAGGSVNKPGNHDWVGPKTLDPIACYVHAELANWGQE